jgi:phosphoglycolate phosphatase-like HAD superfamily hydrolase
MWPPSPGCRVLQARPGPGGGLAGKGRRAGQEAVPTGDTVWDVRACPKSEVPCIGLLSGAISRDELSAAGAAEVYHG